MHSVSKITYYCQQKTSLWERAQTALFHAENPLATRRASQQGQSDDENNVNDSKEKFKID